MPQSNRAHIGTGTGIDEVSSTPPTTGPQVEGAGATRVTSSGPGLSTGRVTNNPAPKGGYLMQHALPARLNLAIPLIILGLFALVASLAPPNAGATKVFPEDTTNPDQSVRAEATLKGNQFSWFIPNNAYFPLAVGCTMSSAEFDIPSSAGPQDMPAGWDFNENRSAVGTFSDDSGGVIMNVIGSPTFAGCSIYNLLPGAPMPAQQYTQSSPPPVEVPGVTVAASENWTVSVDNINGSDVVAAIALPPDAAQITIPTLEGNCVLNVTDDKAQAIMADFVNADPKEETDAELLVDSQLKFVQDDSSVIDCSDLGFDTTSKKGPAIAQFEGDYDVTSDEGPVIVDQ